MWSSSATCATWRRKLIGALSKGYRQRVGLADALVHDPELLILDEPTIGLDPNQIRQVRELIKNLGGKRTVLISTHILPEVEIMCSRVIVIHKGKIRASDTAENLLKNQRTAGSMRIEAKVGTDNAAADLGRLPGVKDVAVEKDGDFSVFQLRLEANTDPSEEVMQLAVTRRWTVRELTRRRPTLEDVFVELTHSDS
ncbi:MAG: DUF4162 domain-containing protein [Chthoniobacter sp.]